MAIIMFRKMNTVLTSGFSISQKLDCWPGLRGMKLIHKWSKQNSNQPASPHLQVRVSRAEQGWLDGAYGFSKIEFRFDYHFNIRGVGKTRFEIQSGKAWGTLPYPYLF